MTKPVKFPLQFSNDEDISAFMEAHDGFELVDQGLAEIGETPEFSRRGKSFIELDPETAALVDELVTSGICDTPIDAVSQAVHSYVLAVLPHSDKLVREK
ncbi:hypothetical protein GF339_12055 [candidate division KSB3 bacterium]|uniref:Uncharacterized protein n=1 Tax=candidate division KSB3 bacterium TaxID=2044937 RepID=A0A9D5JW30_9BACT|nr:hypothetical protein [candidate division KSB3 bacterium]MBD3325313.1 hypothetical protein [candidate division KSB3 bacterium]